MSAKSTRAVPFPEAPGRRAWRLGLLLLVIACAVPRGAAACDLVLTQAPEPVRIDYNPFVFGSGEGALDIGLQNRGEEACDLRLSVTDDADQLVQEIDLGGVGLRIRPREESGVRDAPAQTGVFTYALEPSADGRPQLNVAVTRDAVADAGEYALDLKLAVADADGVTLLPSIPIRLVLTSTPRAQLNLAGASGAFGSGSSVEVVDFGEAETGATRRIFVQVRANAPSTLTISSENKGVMRLLADVENPTTIPYAVELDGEPVDLTKLWTSDVDPPRTLAGASLPMVFTLGRVEGQMAGRYEDLITIDVSPH